MTLATAQAAESDKRELTELRRAKEEYTQVLAKKDEELAKKNEALAKKDGDLAKAQSDVDMLKVAQTSLLNELNQVKVDVLDVPVLHQRVQTLISEVTELRSELVELRESSYLAEEKANNDVDQANRKLTEAEDKLADVEANHQLVVTNLNKDLELSRGLIESTQKDLELSRAQATSAVYNWLLTPNVHYAVRYLYGYYYAAGFSACREIVHEVSPAFNLQSLRLNDQERFLSTGETLLIRPEVDPVETAPLGFNFDQPLALDMIFPDEVHPDEVPFLEAPAAEVPAPVEDDQAQANDAEFPAPDGEENQAPADNP